MIDLSRPMWINSRPVVAVVPVQRTISTKCGFIRKEYSVEKLRISSKLASSPPTKKSVDWLYYEQSVLDEGLHEKGDIFQPSNVAVSKILGYLMYELGA